MSAAPETLPVVTATSTLSPQVASGVPPSTPAAPRLSRTKHTVHWFRKGLRLHDNPALLEGLKDAVTFRCVFIIDPWFASSSNVGINKWRFLLQCLEDLDENLKKVNSRLFVVRGQPADALPKLFRDWSTTTLTFEEDPEPYGRVRDHNITTKCREVGINVISQVSHTLYKLDKIIELNGGKAPLTYHQFQALIASMSPPPYAEPAISVQTLDGAVTPISADHDDRFGVPTLEELGFETENLKPPVWLGGETEALARLERHLERKAWVASFGRPKMTPQSLLASQTGLSPYLRFGCLSTRLFYYQLTELYKRVKRVRPPLSLHGQILWREFFYCAATRNPNFDRMEGNPICVQIPWEKNQDALAKWATGQTGYPWIDSIMIQLREEGWIHHLARHAVACFLTRGDLWISWEEGMKGYFDILSSTREISTKKSHVGEVLIMHISLGTDRQLLKRVRATCAGSCCRCQRARVFDELLLDADWSVNAGMWMWLSCSSFFQQFFHCYCPVRFGRKTDPNGDFIRRYIPALRSMPTRYIHEPWVAPESVQISARCIIGRDYPLPMVDHTKASQVNIERIKQVYAQLAKFKPQGALNPHPVQRPNTMQSSPSPTSIIASINQSNFLCSQTPEPQSDNSQPKDDAIFQLPGKIEASKQIQFKQVYIVQNLENCIMGTDKKTDSPRKNFYVDNQQFKPNLMKHPFKEQKYDFSNYANNFIANYPPGIYQQLTKNEVIYSQQKVRLNTFDDSKLKLYMSTLAENGLRFQSSRHVALPLTCNYSKRSKETNKDKSDDDDDDTTMRTEKKPFDNQAPSDKCKFENKDNIDRE